MHLETCEAPICAGDQNKNYKKEVLWYPGEKVCGKIPFQKFQKKQALMNRYLIAGKFKHVGRFWTAEMLEKRNQVMKAKGGNPEL